MLFYFILRQIHLKSTSLHVKLIWSQKYCILSFFIFKLKKRWQKLLPGSMFSQMFSYKKSSLDVEIWLHLNDQHKPPRWPKNEEKTCFIFEQNLLIYLNSDMGLTINLTALQHFNLISIIRPTIFVKNLKVIKATIFWLCIIKTNFFGTNKNKHKINKKILI